MGIVKLIDYTVDPVYTISLAAGACADQLRTYRLASHNMLSQRHVDLLNREFIHPHKGLELCEGVLEMERKQKEFYALLVNNGVPKEDARYYMGIGISTHMFTACNFRELRHILKQRLVPRAHNGK
jgi:thymidylate synthase (FAD)